MAGWAIARSPFFSGLAAAGVFSVSTQALAQNIDDFMECYEVGRECVDSADRVIGGETVSRDCWEYARKFLCYGEPESRQCNLASMSEDPRWEMVASSGIQYPYTYSEYDNVLPFRWIETWQTTDAICDATMEYGCGPVINETPLLDANGEVIGVRTEQRCYSGEVPRCNNDPNCSLTERTCTDEQDGLCVRMEQDYLCLEGGNCDPSQWEIIPEVDSDSRFTDAVAAAAMLDLLAEEAAFDEDFRIFTGRERECRALTSQGKRMIENTAMVSAAIATYFGGPLGALLAGAAAADIAAAVKYMSCCHDHPEDVALTSSFIANLTGVADYCDMEDVELAAARMAGRATHTHPHRWFERTDNTICSVGHQLLSPSGPAAGSMGGQPQVCSHWAKPHTLINSQTQIDEYQRWCEFDSMLGRLIQEQGRDQLAALAQQNVGGAQTRSMDFDFYGNGGWTEEVNVNGNRVRYWQWDSACAGETDEAAERMAESMLGGFDCPMSTDVPIAICSSQSGCGEPPGNPIFGHGGGWQVYSLRAEDHHARALNRYAVVSGGCFEDGGCEYEVSAWPAERGGQMRIPLDMTWPVQFPINPGWGQFSWSHNNVHFQAYSYDMDASNPQPRLRMCLGTWSQCVDRGQGWSEVDLGSDGLRNLNNQVASSPTVMLTGGCTNGECDYRATIEVPLYAKPWSRYSESRARPCVLRLPIVGCVARASVTYNRQHDPDCSGFTIEEFLALDIAAMDLTEYIETLTEQAQEEFIRAWIQQ